ncbi:g395 [Coccomyxa elongata]
MEPSLQVCSRLFRDLGGEQPPLKRLTWNEMDEFQHKGYIILDNFMGWDIAARVRSEALSLFRQGRFQEASRIGVGHGRDFTDRTARGDHILWLHPGKAPATLPALAAYLNALQELQADLRQVMHLRQRSAEYQLSHYGSNGAQYVRHRDAFPDDGSEEQQRRVTAILYANPNWCPADGGKLRLWPPRTVEPMSSMSSVRAGLAAGSSPRASLCLSESPCSNGGFAPNISQNGHAHRDGSPADSAQNGLSLEDKPQEPSLDSSGCLPDQPPPLLNGHAHTGLANGSGLAANLNGSGRVAYSDASSDTASNRSESSNLRLAAMTPQHAPRLQGSVASSVLAEATEASLLDSLADGTSSIDEGSLVDSIRGNRDMEEPGAKSTEVGTEPVVDVAPVGGRLVLFLSGAVEHAVLPNLAQRIALTAWCQ